MKLTSLKEVLLKKSEGNKNLQTLIEYMGADVLANSVVESLEKMAALGHNANYPTRKFGELHDTIDKDQLRDAVGHHLGHYKAALKAHHEAPEGSPEKAKFRQVADEHLDKVLPLLHLAGKAAYHSKGELKLKYPNMHVWESNYTSMRPSDKNPNRRHRDSKGLGAYTVKSKGKRGAGEDGYGIPNHHYFEMPPNPGHPKIAGMKHTGGYPWEEIQLGHPDEIDAGTAHLDIPDVEPKDKFTPHVFDKHPITKAHMVSAEHTSPEMKKQYAKDLEAYRESPEYEQWLANEEEREKTDPEYRTKGQQKGEHFYEGMPLKPQRGHVNEYPHVPRNLDNEADSWETEEYDPAIEGKKYADDDVEESANAPAAAAPQQVAPKQAAVPPKVNKKPKAMSMEDKYAAWQGLSPEHQESFLHMIPGLADYVAKKKGGG